MELIPFFGIVIIAILGFSFWANEMYNDKPKLKFETQPVKKEPFKMEVPKGTFRIVPSSLTQSFQVEQYLPTRYYEGPQYHWFTLDIQGYQYGYPNTNKFAIFYSVKEAEDFIHKLCDKKRLEDEARRIQKEFIKNNPPKIVKACS